MLDCCPKATSLTAIPTAECPFHIRQIQKLVFQRKDNSIVTIGDELLVATWTALLSATDSTKVVSTPFIGGNPIITAGEPITEGGGDNSTLNGVEEVRGTNPSIFTAEFRGLSVLQEQALQSLGCEDLQVYFIAENGNMIGEKVDYGDGDIVKGFDIQAFHMTDRDAQGYAQDDKHRVRFNLKQRWSNSLYSFKPTDFNPLTLF